MVTNTQSANGAGLNFLSTCHRVPASCSKEAKGGIRQTLFIGYFFNLHKKQIEGIMVGCVWSGNSTSLNSRTCI